MTMIHSDGFLPGMENARPKLFIGTSFAKKQFSYQPKVPGVLQIMLTIFCREPGRAKIYRH
jgi:hypothetical protein